MTIDLAESDNYQTWVDEDQSFFLTMKDRGVTLCFLTEGDIDELVDHLTQVKMALRTH